MNVVDHLLQRRLFDEALARAEEIVPLLPPSRGAALRRRCLASLGRFEEAAVCGRAALAEEDAAPEEYFRLAQILIERRLWKEALTTGLAALKRGMIHDPRYLSALAAPVLAEPALLPELSEGLAFVGISPRETPQAAPQAANPTAAQGEALIFAPQKQSYYRLYDADHPGTIGMLRRRRTLRVIMPEDQTGDMTAALSMLVAAVRCGLEAIPALLAAHPMVDRAAAARYVAGRLPSVMVDDGGADLDFLTNLPLTLNRRPWVLWYDVLALLFQPLEPFENMAVSREASPWYWIMQSVLESPRCRAIFTHYALADNPLTQLFPSPAIADKLIFINPIYADHDGEDHGFFRPRSGRGKITLLFTTSHSYKDSTFFFRGGVDALCAFLDLADEFDDIELILRSPLPGILDPTLKEKISSHPRVFWRKDFIPASEYRRIMSEVDLFLAPFVVLYRNGLAQAIKAGQVPVIADVLGVEEFVEHGRTGMVVSGRRALTRVDPARRAFRQDWTSLLKAVDRPADPAFYGAFVAALRRLLSNRDMIARMSAQGLERGAARWSGAGDLDRFEQAMTRAASLN